MPQINISLTCAAEWRSLLARATNHLDEELTGQFLENLVENKVKFIVFCHHYEVMDQIEDSIVKKKINYIRIDGQIEATKRYDAVNKF